jgi:hypothetical protein
MVTMDISNLIFPFFYNKTYINGLLEKGYVPAEEGSRAILIQQGFLAADTNVPAITESK